MDYFHGIKQDTMLLFSEFPAHSLKESSFLLRPVFLNGLSSISHFLILISVFILRIYKRNQNYERREQNVRNFLYYKTTVFFCVLLSLFHLVLCIFNYFWSRPDWSNEAIVTQLDLIFRLLSWFAIVAYLKIEFPYSNEKNFPVIFRIWWGFYFVLSCCCVIQLVSHGKNGIVPIHLWVLNIVSAFVGLVLLVIGFFGKKVDEENPNLREPLLNVSDINDVCQKHSSDLVTPYSNANIFSILTFSWLNSLLATGHKKTIDLDDVPHLATSDSAKGIFPLFESYVEFGTRDSDDVSKKITAIKLAKALYYSARKEVLLTAFFTIVYTVATYVGPYLIDDFVQYLNGYEEFTNEGYLLVSTFFLAKLVECLVQRYWFFKLQQIGIRARSALISIIYKKGLTLSSQSRQSHTSGEIINFMSVDAGRIGDFSWFLHDIWMVPLQVLLALAILYKNLGIASFSALAATIIVMLMNFPLGGMQERFQEKLMDSKDVRMKSTSEVLRNMRILKLQGWEMKFLDKIIRFRENEQSWLKKYVYTSAMTTFVFYCAPTFVSVITFGTCMLIGIPLESGKVLSSLATFRILQEPIYNLPEVISMIVQTKVSLDRIASFLNLGDLQLDIVKKIPKSKTSVAVEINNGNYSWDISSSTPSLKDLNLRVLHGMKVAVCGTVGSGKSSLLSCILGEMPKISGCIQLSGTKAYVPQSPWIQSGTIEENILFGKEMDRGKYDQVLEACSLRKDLEILSFGDQTVIGERGINLSGGQKQRIQIARALYQETDIYLFDDPFSAVDAHTGTHLFKECLLGFLGSKTVIYVTHQVEFLPFADLILVMKDGRIAQTGKYEEILNSGTDFMELVGAHKKAMSTLSSIEGSKNANNSNNDVPSELGNSEFIHNREKDQNNDDLTEIKGQLIQEEEREKGKVGFSVYWKYITTSYGGLLMPFILLTQIMFQILQIGSNYWMAWAAPVSKDVASPIPGLVLILVYVLLAFGSGICVLIRALLLATAGYKTATILFNKMHMSIFRAPMSFFDSTPSGRILSRASTDQSEVDISIPFHIGSCLSALIQLLGIMAVMSQIAWQVFIIFIPVISACIWYQKYYLSTARELSRLVGVSKAPVIQHFSETIAGTATIRGFEQESRFMEKNLHLVDAYSRPNFHNVGAMEWLCFRLDMLSSLTFAFSLLFLIYMPKGLIDPSVAGLAVTYGLNLNMIQAWLIWTMCNLENKIISVERIFQYTSIDSEPPLIIESNRPENSWPSHGDVRIQDLQVRYAPHLPLVLKGITCSFSGGMRTGIVGRTGSGKSTLIQTLFRIMDPTAGKILIDGVDISTIGLHDLRSRLSIIPQDPTMFEGTVRSNLDPLEEYTDEQIWEALDRCQLGEEVRKKEEKLDSKVVENGENWSMGQRQLVCLGRVILKRSKLLVLDEATASVDTATDNLIQLTIKQQFADSTIITIAHRITSVLDSDMVLLLDNGTVMEYDSPSRLLEDKSSLFAKLVAEYTLRSSSSLI